METFRSIFSLLYDIAITIIVVRLAQYLRMVPAVALSTNSEQVDHDVEQPIILQRSKHDIDLENRRMFRDYSIQWQLKARYTWTAPGPLPSRAKKSSLLRPNPELLWHLLNRASADGQSHAHARSSIGGVWQTDDCSRLREASSSAETIGRDATSRAFLRSALVHRNRYSSSQWVTFAQSLQTMSDLNNTEIATAAEPETLISPETQLTPYDCVTVQRDMPKIDFGAAEISEEPRRVVRENRDVEQCDCHRGKHRYSDHYFRSVSFGEAGGSC